MGRHHLGRSFGTSGCRNVDRFPEGSCRGSGTQSHILTVKWRQWSGGVSPGSHGGALEFFLAAMLLAVLFRAVFHGFHKLPNIWQYLSFISDYIARTDSVICNYLDQ